MEFNDFRGRRHSLFGYFVAAISGGLVGGFLLLLLGPSTLFSKFQPATQPPPVTGMAQSITTTTSSGISPITLAAAKVSPCVVGVVRPIVGKGNKNTGEAEVGTGVVVDPSGYILTNNHVADLSKDLTISLYDGTNVIGRSVWADPVLDISIIKVNTKGKSLNYATLGNSRAVNVGDTVIAIGNPLGLKFQRSVTSGIISAIDRTVQMSPTVYMEDLIQTDASINPGNSGGPLININGEVIGINTVKVSTAEGMGFAIPINMAKPIIASIKKTGKFVEPVLGIKGIDIGMAPYYENKYKVEQGVYVYFSAPGSPAYTAGIRPGDSIISVNGNVINSLLDLKENLYNIGMGGTAVITYLTPLKLKKTVSVKLVEF